ncbi:MAG: hypothetical protein IIA81_03045 [Thaumarchaeota archaeon]|nr:hypothetical protein [Nitrososphaerota archaeon]
MSTKSKKDNIVKFGHTVELGELNIAANSLINIDSASRAQRIADIATNSAKDVFVHNGVVTTNPILQHSMYVDPSSPRFEIKDDSIFHNQQDAVLGNMHEPMSEQDKQIKELQSTVFELQLNDERKDIIIQEIREKFEKKPRKAKTRKQKSKSVSEKAKMQAEINNLKKTVAKYECQWRFTKDMHSEEAKDISEE